MYVIVSHGGHQYRVSPGEHLLVDRLENEIGSTVELTALFVAEKDGQGKPAKDTVVTAKVISHHRGRKLRVFKYKPKKRNRRTIGHRSHLTELEVQSVGAKADAARKPAKKEETEDGA
jgi:large subunit ribosomal protein L21